jgi:hypothetical protein
MYFEILCQKPQNIFGIYKKEIRKNFSEIELA